MTDEARITINGQALSAAQAMTLRVALQSFATEMEDDNALGTDQIGRDITQGYRARIHEINTLLQ